MKTAILVDGGFYRKRAAALWGVRSAKERAKELIAYCQAHIKNQGAELYIMTVRHSMVMCIIRSNKKILI